jgi:sugar (pentulose or hexulose) kinase
MDKRFLMAFDLGNGSGRCMLLDLKSKDTFVEKKNWTYTVAPNTAGIGYDMDLEDMWLKLGEASRDVLQKSAVKPGEVLGIAATSMRNTTILLDQNDGILIAVPNQDARALGEAMVLGVERGAEIYQAGGHWPSPIFTCSRLLWLKEKMPELLKRSWRLACLSDWVAYRLTGDLFAERSQAGETLLFNHRTGDWDFGLIQSLGLPKSIFPATVDTGDRIGVLTKEAASFLGLTPGIPVAAGGADTQSGLLGAGCVRDDDIGVIAGTGMPVQLVTKKYTLDGEGRLWSGRHAVPGLYVLESNGLLTGKVLEWFAHILYHDSDSPMEKLFQESGISEPGAAGVYSTFGAHVFDARTINILLGNLTMSHMVTPDTSKCRCHIARALIEGIAYSARANLEQIVNVTGSQATVVTLAGGMSRSSLWTQMVSDVIGKRVRVPSTFEVTALGAVICAGVGAGVFPSITDGASHLGNIIREHAPGADAAKYEKFYNVWKEAFALRSKSDEVIANQMAAMLLESGLGSS